VPLEISIDDGPPVQVEVARRANGHAELELDGRAYRGQLHALADAFQCVVGELSETVQLVTVGDNVFIHAFGRAWRTEIVDPRVRAASVGVAADWATAPMPGTVIAIHVESGSAVSAGQPLVVIESMKMQSEIIATRDGQVATVRVRLGDNFDRGAVLVELEPETQQ
jgi:acetyl/propionyl-CoA carboxylase alpha subunit